MKIVLLLELRLVSTGQLLITFDKSYISEIVEFLKEIADSICLLTLDVQKLW